ncbi:MAG: hypothetical protein LBG80_02210 [Bacteroidales bacterium]|nr:hypothetical protein [Bacteroidales bacterium]
MKRMKQIFLGLFLQLCIGFVYGQSKVEYIELEGDTFIKISSDVIIEFLDQSTEKWEMLMQENDYQKKHEVNGLVVYSKGERGKRFHAIGKNQNNMLTVDWYDYDEKVKTMDELEKSMENESIKKDDKASYYVHNGHFIVVESLQDEKHVFERVYVIKK